MAEYRFITCWHLPAPPQRVWDVLGDGARYPEWWPAYKHYRLLTPGVSGVGSETEAVVRGRLPYDVRYRLLITRFDVPRESAYVASGDLVGDGRMVYEADGETTRLTIYWTVRTTGFWLNLMSPLLKPVFAWNHNSVMALGERGLKKRLAEGKGV